VANRVIVIGLDECMEALGDVANLIEDIPDIVPIMLEEDMLKFVHILNGYLSSTIYHKHGFAGASAPYAGYEADRGDKLAGGRTGHDFAQRAIDAFDVEKLADRIVDPF
jgi:hypothetical protein